MAPQLPRRPGSEELERQILDRVRQIQEEANILRSESQDDDDDFHDAEDFIAPQQQRPHANTWPQQTTQLVENELASHTPVCDALLADHVCGEQVYLDLDDDEFTNPVDCEIEAPRGSSSTAVEYEDAELRLGCFGIESFGQEAKESSEQEAYYGGRVPCYLVFEERVAHPDGTFPSDRMAGHGEKSILSTVSSWLSLTDLADAAEKEETPHVEPDMRDDAIEATVPAPPDAIPVLSTVSSWLSLTDSVAAAEEAEDEAPVYEADGAHVCEADDTPVYEADTAVYEADDARSDANRATVPSPDATLVRKHRAGSPQAIIDVAIAISADQQIIG